MVNFVQEGKVIDFTNSGSAITAGSVVIQGKIIGIAVSDIAATTGTGELAIKGVFSLPLHASLAITAGDEVFWSGTAVTKTTTDSPLGFAVTSQNSGDATVNVLINPTGSGAFSVAADVAALTDSTGGTPATTLAAITAGSSYAQADAVAIKNGIASLNAQIDNILTSLQAAGLMG